MEESQWFQETTRGVIYGNGRLEKFKLKHI